MVDSAVLDKLQPRTVEHVPTQRMSVVSQATTKHRRPLVDAGFFDVLRFDEAETVRYKYTYLFCFQELPGRSQSFRLFQ